MPYLGNTAGNRFVASKAATQFSGDGSTTAFTLDHAVGSDEDILVSVDGVIQEPSVAYAVSSGTTLTFTAAPSSNSGNNIFVYYLFRTVATVDHPSTSSLQATDGTFSSTLNVTGETTLATHLNMGDNDKIKLGASGDLEVYHDGSNSFVDDTGTGNLFLRGESQVIIGNMTGEQAAVFNDDGAVTLNHDNSAKFATTSSGIDVTGGITADGELDVASSSSLSTISATATGSANLVLGTNFSGSASQGMPNQCGFINMRQNYPIVFGTQETERFRIMSDGRIGHLATANINGAHFTQTINSVNGAGFLLNSTDSSGATHSQIIFRRNGSDIGSIQTNGSSTAYQTSSDYRLKENVTYEFDATSRLKQLKPARFNFKIDKDTTVDGFIAHEVSSIVPESISGEKDAMQVETRYTADDKETQGDNPTKKVGEVKTYSKTKIDPQGIDQAKLVPLLTKALQEALTRIETLETKVTALESK